MNKWVSKNNWERRTGGRRQKRNELPRNDPKKPNGGFDDLYRFLEERYGYSKEKAKEELHRRIRR